MDEREQSLSTRDLAGGSGVGTSETDAAEREPREDSERAAASEEAPAPGDRSGDRDVGEPGAAVADAPPATEPGTTEATGGDQPPAVEGAGALTADSESQATDEGSTAARDLETSGDRPASTDEMTAGRGRESDALLPADENAEFQRRWESLQTGFVDEPRRTVEQADELVAQVMKRLADGFATERERLEQQWGRGEDISTEDLRVTLQRYRAFFQRLLSA